MSNPATRKFTTRLSCTGDRNDRARHSLHLLPVAVGLQNDPKYSLFDALPFHPVASVSASTSADCYLQLWELDYYHTAQALQDEETDSAEHQNQLVVSVPGVVVKLDNGQYTFRATPDVEGGTVDPSKGKVLLSLERIGQDASDLAVAMPEYESVFELYPILKAQSDDNAVETYHDASVYPVKNIEASLRRQIDERGGFAASFVVDFGANPNSNNAEFANQADEMIATLPTFVVNGGEVKMGRHLWSSYSLLDTKLPELRDAMKDLLGLSEAPPIATLALYGHGIREALLINPSGYNAAGSLRIDRVPDFVQKVKPHLSDAPVIALFACNTAAGLAPNLDAQTRYGQAYPCEELGADGLAWTLFRELVRQDISNPTVWGHMNAAHTTRNPKLRVFSKFGSGDFSSVLFGMPRLADATRATYLQVLRTLNDDGSEFAANPALGRVRIHNANLIRRISLQHAMYLPWRWNGGEDATDSATGFTDAAKTEAGGVLEELRSLVPNPQAMSDDLTYEDDHRAFITGLRDGVADVSLSQNFAYSEIRALADPMRVSVALLKMLQLLRYRSKRGLSPEAILDNGVGVAVRVHPDTAQVRSAVLEQANRMVDEGLLASAAEEEGRIQIAVSSD